MNTNSQNPQVGREFQEKAINLLNQHFGVEFENDIAITIGKPAKEHKFDCVSIDKKYIVECKCYTWTDTGNIPSAKMATLNEAVFYLSFLPNDIEKIIIIKKDVHKKRSETLAEYYTRINKHLLDRVRIFEMDIQCNLLKEIK